ncbi:MAG TPA: T9SS type A sorting domain-containing protein [Bacteroidia bacterium]|jgi:hypothetical protein|nr:T9SS type A sorting domain-containing protein [Bacteroidia bacterium]
MKKTLLLLSIAFTFGCFQTVKAQAIPDSSFSIWTHNSTSTPYDDPNPLPMIGSGWQDMNFTSSPLWGSSPVSLFKDSVNYHSAKYSAKLTSVILSSLTVGLLGSGLPNDTLGFMFLGTINTSSGKLTSGVPYVGRPSSLKFWYEYAPVGNDTGFIYSQLTKWNASKGWHDTVATGIFYVNTTVSSFTQYSMTYYYTANYLSSGNPDTVILFASSSSLHHGKAHPGSTLRLDDFTWGSASSGTPEIFANNENISVYPNPATNSVTFSFAGNKPRMVNLFDIMGNKVKSILITNSITSINIENLADGFYFYQVIDNSNTILQTGKLAIVK